MAQALGIDEASCNGPVNWQVARTNGVIYGAVRATISWGFQDPQFHANWQAMKQLGIHRIAYHVLYPDQPMQNQVDNFLRMVNDDWDDAIASDDIELIRNCNKGQLTNSILAWDEAVSHHAPKVIDYSRKQFIDGYTEIGAWRAQRDWWLAYYLNNREVEAPSPPPLPVGVTKWLIHQNADKFPSWQGLTPESLEMDIDRWNGDSNTVAQYFGVIPPMTMEQRMKRLETMHGL